MSPDQFVDALAAVRLDRVFNPYSDRCLVHDSGDAPLRRRTTLARILRSAASAGVDAIWIGRDLGYRGGRRTGLALTDDIHVPMHGLRWGLRLERPTLGPAIKERTAAVVWQVLAEIRDPVFLWNVFPLHPHDAGNPFSNRSHNAEEQRIGIGMLRSLVDLLRPKRVVCIGGDAAKTLAGLGSTIPAFRVRHPSYGGHNEFLSGIERLYGKRPARTGTGTLL